jgi:hypothetical protein
MAMTKNMLLAPGVLMRSVRTRAVLLLLILACCIAAPAPGDTKFTGGYPNLSAYVAGLNEFTAGSDITIPVVLKNTGLNQYMQVSDTIVAPDDLPNTAKFVTVNLSAGDAPIEIKTDPQMIGDLPGQAMETVVFSATVNADAPAGTYMLPVAISYTTLSSVDEFTSVPTAKNHYRQNNVTLTVPLVIKAEVIPQVISAVPDNLVAGADGYINLTLKNIGSLDGAKATVNILQDNESPISPVDSSVYIGDFPVGSSVTCQFKVSVDDTAINKSYPVDVVVVYQNNEGDFVNSRTETAGVDVGSKVNFAITSPTITMSPGSRETIRVVYENTGGSTIRSAQARISAVTPFTSSNGVADLGDLAPGQSAVATYQISVASDAVTKLYGIDSEIRYRDALDDTYISDPLKVAVDVKNRTGVAGILSNSVALSIIVAALIGIAYAVWYFRKKRR